MSHYRSLPRLAAVTIALALSLSGCGGSNHTVTLPVPPPTGTVPPPATGDSFFATVYAKAIQLLDNDEPVAIDQIAETRPDNTEPEPVPAG
ncbi:hypothetical protein G4G28_20410 [Massilia sp. Dwa41.01b]|uniref:hypothetical protein n=1 Tax=Massilia sp. Dwa41.01b TaxID=2709302 RepID=UPI001603CC5F|nr:hypothetical protein [Massilia sp. Dwa41.01b]QNA90273.1 hypothetical protein G4G28_20410 [Massilia sp. Dwa41.01b]